MQGITPYYEKKPLTFETDRQQYFLENLKKYDYITLSTEELKELLNLMFINDVVNIETERINYSWQTIAKTILNNIFFEKGRKEYNKFLNNVLHCYSTASLEDLFYEYENIYLFI